jgi:hypothetical protein
VVFDSMAVNPEIAPAIYIVELPPDVEVTKGFSALSGLDGTRDASASP